MKKTIKLITLVLMMAMSSFSRADLALDNISESDLEKVINDFSAVFRHSTVSPASSLGTLFGVEVGVLLGTSTAPGVSGIAADSGGSVDTLPSGSLLLMVSVPMGITLEASILPEIELGAGGAFSNTSLGVKWTMTDTLLDLPLDLATKLSVTTSSLSFTQPVSSVDTKTTFKDQITELSVVASKNFVIVEPYFGLGYISANGELGVEGSSTIFNFTSETKATSKPSGMIYYGGVQANLLFMRLGLEMSKVFDSTKTLAKFSFYF